MQLPFRATVQRRLHQCTRSTHSRRRMVPPEPDQFRLEKLGRAPLPLLVETLTRDSLIHKVCFGTVSSRIHNCCPKQIKFSCSKSRTQKNKFFFKWCNNNDGASRPRELLSCEQAMQLQQLQAVAGVYVLCRVEALQYVLLCSAGRGGGEGERVIVTGGQLLTRSDAEDQSYLLQLFSSQNVAKFLILPTQYTTSLCCKFR